MKKIFLLVLLFSSFVYPQDIQTQSILELKNHSFKIQNSASSIQLPESSIPNHLSRILNEEEQIFKKKNPGLAILYSLLLPGMGELYAENYSSGKYFTIADGVLWGVFAGFNIYGNWQEENYRSFAQSNAGVDISGKDAEYFANIGSYINIDDYNRIQELNRNFENVYNTTTHYWKWDSNGKRKDYRNMWSSSEQAFNDVRFAVGALLLNRLISAINAVRLVTAYNKKLSEENQIDISFGIKNSVSLPSFLTLNMRTQF